MNHKFPALSALFCCLSMALWAQNPAPNKQQQNWPWKDISELSVAKPGKTTPQLPEKFRLLELDVEQLSATLAQLPADFSTRQADKPTMQIELPLPDGSSERFLIFSDPIMHPDLARKYPEIQTFAGRGIDDPTATIRMDLSPHGFNAQILSDKRGSIYISPVAVGDNRHNISYFKKDTKRSKDWKCSVEGADEIALINKANAAEMAGSCGTRREYRLALACTGEYAAFHGGTKPLALAAMNTSMNRVNGVYERECSIRMNIIANDDQIIFLDAATDGYTNNNGGTMLGENQSKVDAVIGSANYDIGHVFSTGGGGIATFSAPCNNAQKAQGVTGSGSPVGDAFDIDYVAHEMGHQFTGTHTFNEGTLGSCGDAGQLTASTAFEPGSGSTIMSYAGICGASDVQPHSDDYFHAANLQQIMAYSQTGTGSTCGTTFAVSNAQPTVNAGPDFTIPFGTPFKLTATGSDPDGNILRYCWEQMDNQLIPNPPSATITGGPVFRSFNPVQSPTRFFPRLPVILDNSLPSTWEVLPTVARTLNFRVTARDYAAGGGCTREDDMVVTVSGSAGPFTVSSIGTNPTCLNAGDNTTIQWNVANTTAAPVNCANVDIWLSLDGGQNFSILLADDTPNDGTQQVNIPVSAITQQGRIMVIASNNIFFNVNNANIRIDCPLNMTVTDNPASGVYRVRETLQTAGTVTILPGTTARFYAGEKITLKPGFWAKHGSDFQAKIKPCDACTAPKPAEKLATQENPKVYFYDLPANERSSLSSDSPLKMTAFPNPFDQTFNICFELPEAGKVEIQLMDLAGRNIQTVYQSAHLEAGVYQIPVNSNQLESGVYVCRILSNGYQAQMKMVKAE
ncbi:MAG: reprolysin-like metallopeptidase [Bacteroidota bacterium]